MIIRAITKKDIPTIRAFTKELSEHERFEGFDVPESYFEENFVGKNRLADFYVIEIDEEVVGMGSIVLLASTYIGSHELFLRDFIITKKHRGRGYGRNFIKFLCQLAQEKNCKKIVWGVYDWNDEALNLYKKVSNITHDTAMCAMDENQISEMLKS